jgi:NAD(P)-dependent dehydrogenase (short-subunit alcohol dehydrogenase family)
MTKPEDAVVVITGASSGIGRATAMALAGHGARLVLASRQQDAMEVLARQCKDLGGKALGTAVDVTDEAAVHELARRAIDEFGQLDVWINNAAVTLFGLFDQVPAEDFRRVIDTNLFGYIHGARASLPYFRKQGRGLLINVGSVVGTTGQPFTSSYVISKFGVKGLSKALNQDLAGEKDIHIITVLPPSVDTPLFQHGGNYSGRAIQPIPPVSGAEAVATAIVDAIEKPRELVVVGSSARLGVFIHRFFPSLIEGVVVGITRKKHFTDYPAPSGSGNLYVPDPRWNQVSGGWRNVKRKTPYGLLVGGAAAATAAAAAILIRKR